MTSEKEIKKSANEVDKISESIKILQERDAASRKDVSLSDSSSLISSLRDASGGNQGHTNQGLVSGGVYCSPISTHGYFAGCDGVYSNFDTRGFIASQDGLKIPYSVYHPAAKVHSHSNQGRDQLFQGQHIRNFRMNNQTLVDSDRYKTMGKFNGSRGFDASNELACSPRANKREGSSSLISTKNSLDFLTRKDKYNLQDFQIKYEEATFFMIKSYSEDDVHKSIKYNVWSSTTNGNKKLDAAFRESEARAKESTRCPIFLFFSVNTSGQFVGLAEMIGPVDFDKSMDFWQQDKWRGFFPVKWHIIKDIPNGLFRNIVLENNDNRAVTYSRDTQEIGLPQGLKMLQIFKSFQGETSILDDFGFYEEQEKSLRARRTALGHSGGATKCKNNFSNHVETPRRMDLSRGSNGASTNHKASLVALTKNISLDAHR